MKKKEAPRDGGDSVRVTPSNGKRTIKALLSSENVTERPISDDICPYCYAQEHDMNPADLIGSSATAQWIWGARHRKHSKVADDTCDDAMTVTDTCSRDGI